MDPGAPSLGAADALAARSRAGNRLAPWSRAGASDPRSLWPEPNGRSRRDRAQGAEEARGAGTE